MPLKSWKLVITIKMLATIFSSQSDTLTNNRYSPKEKYSQMDICCNITNYFKQTFSTSQMFMISTWLLNTGFQIGNCCCIGSDQDRISLNNMTIKYTADYWLIWYQILQAIMMRIVLQKVKRIRNEILRVKEFTKLHTAMI